ncbi:MAG TPA: acyltransferase [bacterium]|jgi:acetyltransferase-like isoleucine patch superfamily enzyme
MGVHTDRPLQPDRSAPPRGTSPARDALRALFSLAFVRAMVDGVGHYLYEHVVWRRRIHLSGAARIHPTASIRNAQNVYVGKESHVNYHCCLWAGETASIRIGDYLLMGPGVMMFAGNHGMRRDGPPMMHQPRTEQGQDIVIGDDVWLGAGVIITGGVTIADGVVVAAGAVVTRSIETPYAIAGGIPAKVIGSR